MSMNSVSGTQASAGVYYGYQSATTKAEADNSAEKTEQGVVYEKKTEDATSQKATYSINKMSKEDRDALVKQLKADQQSRQESLMNLVNQMFTKQAGTYSFAKNQTEDSDSIWKFLAGGEYTVDAATKKQAQEDIAEDGYWGIKQTSQRLFDFASALAGDDEDKMRQMQSAMEKGFKQATSAWGRDLPDISNQTLDAANKLFEEYYKSKQGE